MKKIILAALLFSSTSTIYAQEDGKTKVKEDDAKTKVKHDKGKIKDENGKMKIKDGDMSDDGKTKMKDDKIKMKEAGEKVKIKGEGNLNTEAGTSVVSGNNASTTHVNVVTTWEAFPPKPATLPVVGNGVSTEVVTTLKNKYGTGLYDIKQIRSTSGQMIYVVRVMENGGMRNEYVGADGNIVAQ